MTNTTRTGVTLSVLTGSISLLLIVPVHAQQPVMTFDELRRLVTPGETIFVTDASGTTVKGSLVQVAGPSLEVRIPREDAPRRVSERDVNNIVAERRDPWWNGMLVGFTSGAVPGVLLELASGSGNSYQKFDAHGPIGLAAVGFLTGWLIDAVNKEKVTVFVHAPARQSQGVSFAPLVGKSAAGVQMSVKF
jgi:hypothetical protein